MFIIRGADFNTKSANLVAFASQSLGHAAIGYGWGWGGHFLHEGTLQVVVASRNVVGTRLSPINIAHLYRLASFDPNTSPPRVCEESGTPISPISREIKHPPTVA